MIDLLSSLVTQVMYLFVLLNRIPLTFESGFDDDEVL